MTFGLQFFQAIIFFLVFYMFINLIFIICCNIVVIIPK
jgi:hypothetical protein